MAASLASITKQVLLEVNLIWHEVDQENQKVRISEMYIKSRVGPGEVTDVQAEGCEWGKAFTRSGGSIRRPEHTDPEKERTDDWHGSEWEKEKVKVHNGGSIQDHYPASRDGV